MLLAVLGDFGAEAHGSLGKAHLCTGYVCLISRGDPCRSIAGCAFEALTLYWEGTIAGNQKHPAAM